MALCYKLFQTGLVVIFFMVLMFVDSGHSKKTIKIHVPYFVKHIHHYKKVYVPKVQVIKHEHHHKKEHDHHHHHHDHGHDHYHSYDKSGHGYGDESSHYDTYYDEIDSRTYNGEKYPLRRGKYNYRESLQYKGWKDVDGSEYRGGDSAESEEDEEDYSDVIPQSKLRVRSKPSNIVIPIYRKRVRSNRRSEDLSNDTTIPEIER